MADCCGMWSHMATKSTSTSTVRCLADPAGRPATAGGQPHVARAAYTSAGHSAVKSGRDLLRSFKFDRRRCRYVM